MSWLLLAWCAVAVIDAFKDAAPQVPEAARPGEQPDTTTPAGAAQSCENDEARQVAGMATTGSAPREDPGLSLRESVSGCGNRNGSVDCPAGASSSISNERIP